MKKKLILIVAMLGLGGLAAFATGSEGVNPQQTGVVTYTVATGLITTNTFPFAFQTAPVVVLYPSSTNTFTYTSTTTNFTLTSGGGTGATNYTVAYNAYVGGTKMQSGSLSIVSGALNTNVVFGTPYAFTPNVVVTGTLLGAATNAFPVVVTNGPSQFTINTGLAQTVQWISVGTVFNPPSDNTGVNPVSNKVTY